MSPQRPDFVMVGGQQDGKFYIIASKTLTEVELRTEADQLDLSYHQRRMYPPRYRNFITAEMRDWVMVVGDSYAEAFRTLFEEWSPEPERRELDGLRAVTARARNIAYHELSIEPAPPGPLALPAGGD